jgi:hypothetical protein
MAHATTLAMAKITAVDTLAVELVEADETVVIIRWRLKPSVFHQYHVGRGDRSQADCGDQLLGLSASRSRFRFRHSELVGGRASRRSSALPPKDYLTIDHLEPVDADLPS